MLTLSTSNVIVKGGYSADLLENPEVIATPNPTTIGNQTVSAYGGGGHDYSLFLSGGSNMQFQDVAFVVGTAATNKQAIAVFAAGTTNLTLLRTTVTGERVTWPWVSTR